MEFSSEELRQFNHVAFVAPSSAASFSLFLSLSLVLWMRGKVGGMSSIDAALGSFQHQESYLQKGRLLSPRTLQQRSFTCPTSQIPSGLRRELGGGGEAGEVHATSERRCTSLLSIPVDKRRASLVRRCAQPCGSASTLFQLALGEIGVGDVV